MPLIQTPINYMIIILILLKAVNAFKKRRNNSNINLFILSFKLLLFLFIIYPIVAVLSNYTQKVLFTKHIYSRVI